ncbi:MAG: hypothetical protein ACTSYB_12780 [Candidatus Helarchaeota archaeon]
MRILLIGKNQIDSGKTTMGRILINLLKKDNIHLIPFKPHSGFNYWYHYDHLKYCLKIGNLFSRDVYHLLKETDNFGKINPVILNPVHRINGPSGKILQNFYMDQVFLLRFSCITNGEIKTKYYRNERHTGIKKIIKQIESIYKNNQIEKFRTLEQLEKIITDNYMRCIKSCFSYLIKNYEDILIEAFDDIAYPFLEIEKYIDVLILVSPGKLYLLDTKRYFQKCFLKSSFQGMFQLTVPSIVDDSMILEEMELAPLENTDSLDPKEILEKYRGIKSLIFNHM